MSLINGTGYSWSTVGVNILGVKPVGITAISYKDKQDVQQNYGIGTEPVSRSRGKVEYEASITMHKVEVEALQQASPTGRIQDIPPFDIVVSFLPEGGKIVTHTLHNAQFTENGRDVKQGDMEIPIDLPLIISGISYK